LYHIQLYSSMQTRLAPLDHESMQTNLTSRSWTNLSFA
jgi:hypothetical protein